MSREKKYFFLALLAALATSGYIYHLLSQANLTSTVVIAARDIPQNSRIRPEMVKEVQIPERGVHPLATKSIGQVLNKWATADMTAGEQVLTKKVVDNSSHLITLKVPPDHRAVLLPVPLSRSLGGVIRSGDKVDIIFVSDQNKLGFTIAKTLFSSVPVLDVRTESGRSMSDKDKEDNLLGIVVSLTSEEAEKAAFAMEHGHLYLTLNPVDAAPLVATPGTSLQNLFLNLSDNQNLFQGGSQHGSQVNR